MKLKLFSANIIVAVALATLWPVKAAVLQNCQVDKGFDVQAGSHGSDTVQTSSTYCFHLVGTVLNPFPASATAEVGFRTDAGEYIWMAHAPLCSVLTSGPSITHCHGLKNNKEGLTGCIKVPRSSVKPPKSGTALQLSIEFLNAQGAFVCVKGTAKVA